MCVRLYREKLAAGRTEELYHLMRTGKLEDEQKELFYREFDEAFINIYPTFIRDVNALMKDVFQTWRRKTPVILLRNFVYLPSCVLDWTTAVR